MPRMLRRAAVLGATAHVASKRGAARGAAEQEAAEAAAPPPVQEAPPLQEAAPADKYEELTKLKGLFDAGILTQEEFDAEKQKVLAG
jgi:hypothetical protein